MQAFPRPASMQALGAATLALAEGALHAFVPHARVLHVEPNVGTNCVVLRVSTECGDFALRFDPDRDADTREARLRAAITELDPDLVLPPLASVEDGGLHHCTAAGTVTCSPWLAGATPAAVPAHTIAMNDLGARLGRLRRCLEVLPDSLLDGKSPLVYWSDALPDDDDLVRTAGGLAGSAREALGRLRDDIAGLGEPEPLHGDLHAENLILGPTGAVFLDFDFARRKALGAPLDYATLFHRIGRRLPRSAWRRGLDAFRDGYESTARSRMPWRPAVAACCVESLQKLSWIDWRQVAGPDDAYWHEVRRRHEVFLTELVEMSDL